MKQLSIIISFSVFILFFQNCNQVYKANKNNSGDNVITCETCSEPQVQPTGEGETSNLKTLLFHESGGFVPATYPQVRHNTLFDLENKTLSLFFANEIREVKKEVELSEDNLSLLHSAWNKVKIEKIKSPYIIADAPNHYIEFEEQGKNKQTAHLIQDSIEGEAYYVTDGREELIEAINSIIAIQLRRNIEKVSYFRGGWRGVQPNWSYDYTIDFRTREINSKDLDDEFCSLQRDVESAEVTEMIQLLGDLVVRKKQPNEVRIADYGRNVFTLYYTDGTTEAIHLYTKAAFEGDLVSDNSDLLEAFLKDIMDDESVTFLRICQ